ncbi:hypothetical protein A9Q84_07425 [Halobacteriovorax marinus]|uniref:Uncharacterized protein n=1 Tax=Halobacteriovorax marinus TaxID=97084 RepID=A0A1Y5F5L4_9BACT|nr:hypothetical protein A9Q84_07425 [Halobacteriovorax marinus]
MNITFILLITFFNFGLRAEVKVDSFQNTLDKFEKYCIDQNDELREDVYVKEEYYSCRDEMNFLQDEFAKREELMTSNPDIYKQYKDCIANRVKPKVIPFIEQIKDVTEQVTCNADEKAEFEKDCGKAWECNKFRAILSGAKLLPEMIEEPITKFVRNSVQKKNYDSECIGDGRSNCIEDFITAFLSNLWSSASSVWSLVSSGAKSLFNMDSWFDSEADKLQVKATQSKQDVKDFWDSPGLWFSNTMDKLKKGVDEWVKSSVFCQKWEGRAQFSKCLKPLESYECIDCDDKINATCIAIGAIASEAGVAILTAGVGTAASLTARAGARTMAAVAAKVSSKVKAVAPSFKTGSKGKPSSKMMIAASVAAKGISSGTRIAKEYYLITSDKARRIKEKMDKISLAVNNAKVVVVAKKIIEKGNIPARISEKLGEKGVLLAAKVTSKVGKGTLKKEANTLVKLSKKSKRSAKAKGIIQDKSHGKGRTVTHTGKGSRVYSKGKRASETDRKTNTENDRIANSRESRTSSERNSHNQRERAKVSQERSKKKDSQRNLSEQRKSDEQNRITSENKKRDDQRRVDQQSKREQQKKDQQKRLTEESRKKKEKKKLEDKRVAEEKRKKELKNKEKESEENRKKKNIKRGLVASVVAADLAAKGIAISEKQAAKELEQISKAANGKAEKFEKNLFSAKKVLGIDSDFSNSSKDLKQAAAVKEMYSDKNKNEMISQIQKTNSNLSKSEARQVFNDRQSEVNESYDYLDNRNKLNSSSNFSSNSNSNSSSQSISTERRQLSDELAKIKSERKLAGVNSEIASIKSQRDEIKNSIKDTKQVASGDEKLATNDSEQIADSKSSISGSSSSSDIAKKASRIPSGSQSSTIGGASSPTAQISEQGLDEGISSKQETADNTEVDNLEDEIDVLEDESIAETEKKEEKEEALKEQEQRKVGKSKNLKNLLDLLNKKDMKIELDVAFDRDFTEIKVTDAASKQRLKLLKYKVDSGVMATRKVTYQVATGELEIYQFDKENFTLAIDKFGKAELLDESKSNSILQSSVLPDE